VKAFAFENVTPHLRWNRLTPGAFVSHFPPMRLDRQILSIARQRLHDGSKAPPRRKDAFDHHMEANAFAPGSGGIL
jgi:hypothetical protein